ncbi:DUF1194 domain-containing protein [Maritimibacter sp. 55A14]|uniref:DUF1194 domain-containing protein n=1 Tax=Maritimibacter sp. 55A14 TaxID=2174844 RepID=UPI001304838F|nr:DUF1194 domain-containing protein [Maritimibacter sp. 55A14]
MSRKLTFAAVALTALCALNPWRSVRAMRTGHFLVLINSAVVALLTAPAASQERMEVHLVLAFDVSASVNDVEFNLQRQGTAWALRTKSVATAIDEASGGVAVAVVQWSSISRQALGLDWVTLHTLDDALSYADSIEALPRRIPGGGTMIHSGLDFAATMFDTAPGTAIRQVIDIVANGRSDDHDKLLASRDRLLRRGIVINGLAIEEHRDDLTSYFHRFVIGGPSAFVVTAQDFEDFGTAMQMKLYREVAGPVIAERPYRTVVFANAWKGYARQQ